MPLPVIPGRIALWIRPGDSFYPVMSRLPCVATLITALFASLAGRVSSAAEMPLLAGVGRADITREPDGPANDRLFARALVLKSPTTTAVLISVDAVAIGEIGPIRNDYLPKVRARLEQDYQINPASIMVNASHCHGIVSDDVDERTVRAVGDALKNLVPVTIGVGTGHEDRIMENRRLRLKSGREADVRHAYSLPPDDVVVGAGPIDPQIGILRVDRLDGRTLAVAYNFACHPIQGVPGGGNTADLTGFSSRVIEDALGEGAVALFVQGCGGDINPIGYKAVDGPRDAETLGNLLGLSTLRAVRAIRCRPEPRLQVITESLQLPRADLAEKIAALEADQQQLLRSLKGTSLNLKTFLPLMVKYSLAEDFPSYYSHRYLHEQSLGRKDMQNLDAENRRNLRQYIENIQTMEELTRVQTNLALLKKHQASGVAAGRRTVDVGVTGLRVGDFALITFPGELTVQIGLNLKKASPLPNTFVAGYTNGYIYYSPTSEQLLNRGGAQEDSDCILAPEWQAQFETRALEILNRLK